MARTPVNVGSYGRADAAFSSNSTQPQDAISAVVNGVKNFLTPLSPGEAAAFDASLYKVAKKAADAYRGFDFLFPFTPKKRKKI